MQKNIYFQAWPLGCGGRKLKCRLEIRHAWAAETLEGLSPSLFRVLLGKVMGGGGCFLPLLPPSLPQTTQCPPLRDRMYPTNPKGGGGSCQFFLPPPPVSPLHSVAGLQWHLGKPTGSSSAGRLWWFLQTHGADWQIDSQVKGQCREPRGRASGFTIKTPAEHSVRLRRLLV